MKTAKVRINDIIKLKKPHACGANRWLVTKLGMDVGLSCLGCGHEVKVMRSKLNDSWRGIIRRAGKADLNDGHISGD